MISHNYQLRLTDCAAEVGISAIVEIIIRVVKSEHNVDLVAIGIIDPEIRQRAPMVRECEPDALSLDHIFTGIICGPEGGDGGKRAAAGPEGSGDTSNHCSRGGELHGARIGSRCNGKKDKCESSVLCKLKLKRMGLKNN